MQKRLLSAAALSLLLAGAAVAQGPAPTAEVPLATQSGETNTGASTAPATPTQEAASPAPIETGSIPQTSAAEKPATEGGSVAAPSATTEAAMPDSIETCISAAADLGATAESRTLAPEQTDRLDALFSKMEALCDGQEFAEAMVIAKDIKTMLDGN